MDRSLGAALIQLVIGDEAHPWRRADEAHPPGQDVFAQVRVGNPPAHFFVE
jgi:hypothetical protein